MTASAQAIKLITIYASLEKASILLLLAVFYTIPISDIKSRASIYSKMVPPKLPLLKTVFETLKYRKNPILWKIVQKLDFKWKHLFELS